jgi:hypothetical protein
MMKEPPQKKLDHMTKNINSVELKMPVKLMAFRKNVRQLPRRPLVHLTHLFDHRLRLSYFSRSWNIEKIITLPKPGQDPKSPQNL